MFWIAPYTLYLALPWIWVPLGASLGLLRRAEIFYLAGYPITRMGWVPITEL